HATSLFAFGLPIVLFKAYLPVNVQRGAEVAVGVVIVLLAVWLLFRWRRGMFNLHRHDHGEASPSRSPLQAYGLVLGHGAGGSAGVGGLLLPAIHDQLVACLALALFAACTALSMALLSTGFGFTLASGPVRRGFHRVAPVLALASLAFGLWYSLGALDLTRY